VTESGRSLASETPGVRPSSQDGERPTGLSEVVGSLSLATDLATGQPLEHGLRRTLIAVRLGEALGLSGRDLSDVYYVSVLGSVGCTLEATVLARVAADDIAVGGRIASVDVTSPLEVAGFGIRNFGAGEAPLKRAGKLIAAALAGPKEFQAVCRDTALRVAGMLELGPSIEDALAQCHERWSGRGGPRRLKGEGIHSAARIFHVAHDAEVFERIGGSGAGVAIVRRRAGNQYDPTIAHRFVDIGDALLARLDAEPIWDAFVNAEPRPVRQLSVVDVDRLARAIGNFIDLRTPFTFGHSSEVARLADLGAQELGLSEAESGAIRRAGYLHDLGRAGVPIAIWNSSARWTSIDQERARRHPSLTELVLARSPSLGPLGALAGLHHERLDGSGYRSLPASFQPVAARLIAVADAYRTKLESRPHRAALTPDAARRVVEHDAAQGRLDGDVVRAVLDAAGHQRPARGRTAGGLTERELEVLRLLVRGLSNRQIGDALFVSPKTVDHHVQHIYDKLGVSTRVGATLFALQHGLVESETGSDATRPQMG
jgi:HD-GYP domain-containing protein (c-di-GMP phosphodiesterase class II)